MKIDLAALKEAHNARPSSRRSRHTAQNRVKPSLFQFDYLGLVSLATDVSALLADAVERLPEARRVALDVGCDMSRLSRTSGESTMGCRDPRHRSGPRSRSRRYG